MYQETKFENGLRLITSSMPHTRSASIVFFVGAGSRYENDAEAGISHFIEHLCFKGTKKRHTSKEISEAIEGIGGIINGGTDKEITTYWCRMASQHFSLALDVLVDLLLNARFDAEDIDHERQVIIEEINMSYDSPRQRVGMLIDELLWTGHPLGRDVAGTRETVSTISRQQIMDFFVSRYAPNNTVVSIAGQINENEAYDAIQKLLGSWQKQKILEGFPSNSDQKAPKVTIEYRETEQVHLCLAFPGLSLLHPDRFSLDLLNVVLGEGMSSRLFIEIRERRGLAYDIHSYTEHLKDTGSFVIHAGVDPQRIEDLVNAVLEQLVKLRAGVLETELSKAKEMVKGRLLIGLENSQNVAAWFGAQAILTDQILSTDHVISIVEKITTEDLKSTARRLIREDKINLAIVGPIKKEKKIDRLLKM